MAVAWLLYLRDIIPQLRHEHIYYDRLQSAIPPSIIHSQEIEKVFV